MNSSDKPDHVPTTVEISKAAHRVARLAAGEASMPLENWIALAILDTAADQSGLLPADDAQSGPDSVHESLRRLEAKLDQALGNQPGGAIRPGLA